jgi:hypothetical protein
MTVLEILQDFNTDYENADYYLYGNKYTFAELEGEDILDLDATPGGGDIAPEPIGKKYLAYIDFGSDHML